MASETLRTREVRLIDRIVGECCDVGYDAQAWQTHLLREGASLLGLRVGLLAELEDFDPGQSPRLIAATEYGWDCPKQRAAFFNSTHSAGPEPFGISPVDLRFRSQLKPRRAATRVRTDLIGDVEWHNHLVYCDIHRPAGMDELAYSAIRRSGNHVTVLAFGGDESRPGGRQRRALAMLHHEITRRLGSRLASGTDPGRHHLTRCQREVYDMLLSDMSEKAIAAALKRSRSTVTQHIAAVYDHFGVNGRTQLLSRLLARGRNGS